MARILRPHRNAPVLDALQAISGLGCYYRSDLGVTLISGVISQMLDESGLALTMNQAGAGSRPAYASGGINGLPALTSSGTQGMATSGKGALDATAGLHVFVVAQCANTSSNGIVLGTRNGGTGGWDMRIASGTVQMSCWNSVGTRIVANAGTLAANTWALWEGWYDGAHVGGAMNAGAATTTAMTGTILTASSANLGLMAGGDNFTLPLSGKVALAAAFNRSLNGSADQTNARAFINALYAIF